ncbi:MAG: hypothetical protein J6D54_13850 [Olsenella sp.]|nr:hypothetical protein [Olsenella sp.]
MRLAFLVAKALLEGHFASYFARIPSAAEEPEPIVLREGGFEREARFEDSERGTVLVTVLVVREVEAEAEDVAGRAERWLRGYGWELVAENGSWRICGLDTTAPRLKERDGSGRFVYEFDVILTVARSL